MTARRLGDRIARLESAAPVEPARRLVLLVGPEGPSAEQQAQMDEAKRNGQAVGLIELVPAGSQKGEAHADA